MTEAEALEVVQLVATNGITSFTVYSTVTFGYLAAAYFVGRDLTRAQVGILSSLYVFSAVSCLLSLGANMITQSYAVAHAPGHPEGPTSQGEF